MGLEKVTKWELGARITAGGVRGVIDGVVVARVGAPEVLLLLHLLLALLLHPQLRL